MKNILIIIGFIIVPILNLKAQSIDIGIRTGFGFSNTHFTNIPDTDSNSDIFSTTSSYSVNGTLNYKVNEFYGFSTEPGIIKKGWASNKGNNRENIFKMHYIQLPIFVNFYLSNKLFFSIGPEIDYLLNAKVKSKSGSEKIIDLFQNFELSGITGITYNILDNFDIGFKYSHGLTKISDELFWVMDDDINTIKLKGYSQSIQVFIKIRIIKSLQ